VKRRNKWLAAGAAGNAALASFFIPETPAFFWVALVGGLAGYLWEQN